MSNATTTDLDLAAERFHALSDPTRLRILGLLASGERCVCELTDALDVAQSRLSFHLKVLRDADFVSARREGQWMYYTVQRGTIDHAVDVLTMPAATWKRAAKCCT
jgi:ArsR family transcriptional regulator